MVNFSTQMNCSLMTSHAMSRNGFNWACSVAQLSITMTTLRPQTTPKCSLLAELSHVCLALSNATASCSLPSTSSSLSTPPPHTWSKQHYHNNIIVIISAHRVIMINSGKCCKYAMEELPAHLLLWIKRLFRVHYWLRVRDGRWSCLYYWSSFIPRSILSFSMLHAERLGMGLRGMRLLTL